MTEFLVHGKKIPWAWDQVVCSCEDPEYTHWQDIRDKGKKDICTKCQKLPKWQLLTCTECKSQYIWFFGHHLAAEGGWARHKQICWSCLCKHEPPIEGDFPPLYTEPPRQSRSLSEISLGEITFDNL